MEKLNDLAVQMPVPKDISGLDVSIDNRKDYYSNIIRATTSDRNKAKASKELLDKLAYSIEYIAQLVYSLSGEGTPKVEHLLVNKVLDVLSDTGGLFYMDVIYANILDKKLYNEHDLEFVEKFGNLMSYLTTAKSTEVYLPTFNSRNAIDIIVHGTTSLGPHIKLDEYNVTYSKLLSQYFEFISRVKFNLSSESGVDYLKKVIEKSNNLEGTYGYGN